MIIETFLVALLAAVAGAGILALLARFNNYLEFEKYPRLRLAKSVRRLRLFKMLAILGIPFDLYMKLVPIQDIERHVVNCRRCGQLEACDECLETRRCVANIQFCPNYASLVTFKAPE